MSQPMKFRRLVVRRMPGFEDRGFSLEGLSGGINLVHGPNASGKTTAARAIQRLLWPKAGSGRATVSGLLSLDGVQWRVDLDGSEVRWERDGVPSDHAPTIPPVTACHRYFLSLTDLLKNDDQELAALIRADTYGGYRLPEAAQQLEFGPGGQPRGLLTDLKTARAAREEARQQAERLRQERSELRDLRSKSERLRESAATASTLERARELADARSALEAAEREAAAFPAALSKLSGSEVERLEDWAAQERELRAAVTASSTRESQATDDLERADLGEDGLPSSRLTELEKKLDAIRKHAAAVEQAAADRDDARARRARAGRSLGIDSAGSTLPDPSEVDLGRLDALLRRVEEVRRDRATLDSWLELLGEGEDAGEAAAGPSAPADDASLDEAIRVLRAWLRAGTGGEVSRRWGRLVAASIAVLAVLAVALGLAGFAWAPAWGLAGVAAIAAIVVFAGRPTGSDPGRSGLEVEARRLGHAPDEWTESAVADRLDELQRAAAARALDRQRVAQLEQWRKRRPKVEAEEAEVERERAALAAELGIAPGADPLTLVTLAGRLRDWDEARRDEAAADARLESATADRDGALDEARALVADHGYAPGDADAVAGALAALRDRRERHEKAATALESARRDRERAERDLEELASKRESLLETVGVADEHALRDLAAQRDAFVAADRALDAARRDATSAERALRETVERAVDLSEDEPARAEEVDAVVARLTAASPEDLADRLEKAAAAAEEERGVADRIVGIEARLEDARRRHDLEDAMAAVDRAKAALADQREADIDGAIGEALVDWLRSSALDTSYPEVFRRAEELLGAITRGHYRLELDPDGDAFRAYDNVAERGRSLDELSAGTRLQLLLSVRIAFVETQEQGAAPPLLLDEVLANCDDHRARAIIDAALGLARAGRQVFYFTAQGDELVKWREALAEQDDVEWCQREIRDTGPEGPALDWTGRVVSRDAVPEPAGLDHAAYGEKLGVPGFDPWAEGVGGLHLWYLVDDADALHTLLGLGVDRWGKLRHFAEAGGADVAVVRSVLADARRAADLCDQFVELWRRGRGRPVTRAVLEECDAITDTFIDRVADLCERLDGNGAALVDALRRGEVARFRSSSAEELDGYLRQHGYLPDQEPLSPDRIRVALIAAATRDGDAATAADRVRRLLERLTGAERAHAGRDAAGAPPEGGR